MNFHLHIYKWRRSRARLFLFESFNILLLLYIFSAQMIPGVVKAESSEVHPNAIAYQEFISSFNPLMNPQQSTTGPYPPRGVENKTTDTIPLKSTDKVISGVPGYLWRHSCGPPLWELWDIMIRMDTRNLSPEMLAHKRNR